MTVELLTEVLAEFTWPAKYALEDDLPDGVIVSFPKSNFAFTEGFDGDVRVKFLSVDTGGRGGLDLAHALMVYVPLGQRTTAPMTPGLIEIKSPFPSEENTRNGIRNACTIMLTHLTPVIEGDFSWVAKYLKIVASSHDCAK